MKHLNKHFVDITPTERQRRKSYLAATVITCIALIMIFGTAHVVKLGANRMADMKSKAGYDVKDERKHIRAAGEDIQLQRVHEEQKSTNDSYAMSEINGMISDQQWLDLESMILIPAGESIIGTDSERSDEQDRPQHRVQLADFYIDKYPVTNVQYAKFVSETKHRAPLDWDKGKIPDKKILHPVVMVSWYDAKAYCEYVEKRLPSELEWEKAARGVDGKRWPWGNTMIPTKLNTYYNVGSTSAVTHYSEGKSDYGVFDLAGNVSEWTASDFAPYQGSTATPNIFQPKVMIAAETPEERAMHLATLVPVKGIVYKVRRGGSWKSDPFATSAYHRNFSMPHYASDFFGFRCARDQ